MKNTVFSNNEGHLTSIRLNNDNMFQTLSASGNAKGTTTKLGKTTFRYSEHGNLLGIGVKVNSKYQYSDPMGKKLTALKPY